MNTPLSLATSRLQLRWLEPGDAAFILRLVNDAHWLRFIGDKQVDNQDAARNYIESGPRAMYRAFGFGLNRIALKQDDTPVGVCGLLQRESLPDCDLGFALLPEFRRRGYAFEAASAVLQHGFTQCDKSRIAAIVSAQNSASIRLLEKLGFHYERAICMEPNQHPVDLYVIQPNS